MVTETEFGRHKDRLSTEAMPQIFFYLKKKYKRKQDLFPGRYKSGGGGVLFKKNIQI